MLLPPLLDPLRAGAIALDVMAASRLGREAIVRRQQARLAALLDLAAERSPLYRERLRGRRPASLADVPPANKGELMRRFADWVTDPGLRLDALRRFVADPRCVGEPLAGGYTVWESSGSTGEPALFVQDAQAMAVYDALEAWRRPRIRWWNPWLVGERIAFVGATTGHFASTVSVERLRRMNLGMATALRGFSFLQPAAALVAELNRWQPTVIATYPTAALLLAEEAAAGRLAIELQEMWTGGEPLTPPVRQYVARQLGCIVTNSYGASEFLALASECRLQRLHLNIDWVILESVDASLLPVPAGTPGATTLVTNLANRVQPVIRYDIGDRVALHEQPCACGSPLPVIEVQGRVDDSLVLDDGRGRAVRLLPLALTTVLEDEAGLFDFQLAQQGSDGLKLSVPCAGEEGERALRRGRAALQAYLNAQGLGQVRLHGACGVAPVRGRSGKAPRVVAG